MAYQRARPAWHDFPQTDTLVRAQDYEVWDGGLATLNAQKFYPRNYGTDGTGAAIQGALNAAHSAGSGVVELTPDLSYSTSSTLLQYSNTILRGNGWGSIIKGTAGANPILKGTDPTQGLVEGCGVEDLLIDGTSVATGLTGLYWTNYVAGSPITAGRNNWVKGVKVRNCGTGVHCVFDQGLAMSSCAIHENGTGLYISDDSQLGFVSQCDFRYNTVAGTVLEATNNVKGTTADRIYGWNFNRCHWESNTGKGVVLDGATFNTFQTCKWEDNHDAFVTFQDTNSTYRPDGNIFINGTWNGCTSVPTVLQVNMVKGVGNIFLGGSCNPTSTGGWSLSAATFSNLMLGTTFVDKTKLSDASGSNFYFAPSGTQRMNLEAASVGITANRPSVTYPGMLWYDTTLDRPIWRNAANSNWVKADGTVV